MTRYCLNGNVTFCISTSKLIAGCNTAEKNEIKLDNLESLVLEKLVGNCYHLVNHEELLSNWRSSEATVNSLRRVISLLRTKLKKVGITEKVILTTPKKGYTFTTSVELEIDLESHISVRKKNDSNIKQTNNRVYLIVITFVLLVVLSLFIQLQYSETTNKYFENIRNIELLNNTDIKLELAANLENNFIAYSTKAYNGRYWNIAIFNRFSDKSIVIEHDNSNVRKPTWLSKNKLIYRVYNENNCRIQVANIDFSSENYTSNKLFSCNPESFSSSIAKLNASQILFTDSELGGKASNLYIGDIETGVISPIVIDNEGGVGIYNVVTSEKSELVVLLSSPDGIHDKIRLVNPNKEWEVVWTETLMMTNISVGWDGSLLSFRNDKGGISVINFEEQNEVNRTDLPFIAPVHNIHSLNNGLLFTSGEFITQNIAFTDLQNSKSQLLTENSNATNKLASFYTKNLILYVSNRTGVNQIWLHNLDNKTSKQVSSFKQNYPIDNIATSFTYSKIALEFDNNIVLFDLSSEHFLSNDSIKIDGIKPEFFKDSLIFAKSDGVQSGLLSFSLLNSRINGIEIENGYIAKSYEKNLYYSKQYAPGIWLYREDDEDKLILDLPSSSYQWHIDLDSIYYQNDIGDNFKFNIKNGLITPFFSESCHEIINLKNNKCLSVEITPSSNRVILLEW
ncbi:MAG: winged helix-turn-helix domain-containing protein [Colwellia sp.]|nr:winged helix-turn-helix domain-containing protein [Colwellia sp.]